MSDLSEPHIKKSQDCFECVNCVRRKNNHKQIQAAECNLSKSGYTEDQSIEACGYHKPILFHNRNEQSFLPYQVWIEITNACNLRCRMCGQRGDGGYLNEPASPMHRKNLPLEQWIKFIDEIKSYHPFILLRGGEPFLYPHIDELIGHIAESNLYLAIDTNGTQLTKHATAIASYVDRLNISVDGPPEIHDYVRGEAGSFAQIKQGVEAVQREFKKIKRLRIDPLAITCTVSHYNYHALGGMVAVAEELGIKEVNLQLCYYFDTKVGEEYEKRMDETFGIKPLSWKGFQREDRKIDYAVLKQTIRGLINHKGKVRFNLVPDLDDSSLEQWFTDPSVAVNYDRCYAPWFMANVMPNGDVNFCCDFGDYIIGNITQSPLLDLWRNEKAQKFRKEIMKKRFSICRRCGVNSYSPYNRNAGLLPLKPLTSIIRAGLKIPFIKKRFEKFEWLSHQFY